MGLYDDDNAGVTGGELIDEEYWESRTYSEMVESALKSKQTESMVRQLMQDAIKEYDKLLAKYPNHGDVKKWKEKAENILKKTDPNAPGGDWKPGWPWQQAEYYKAWNLYHKAKYAKSVGDWGTCKKAASFGSGAAKQILESPARYMRNWTDNDAKWLSNAANEMDALYEEAKKK